MTGQAYPPTHSTFPSRQRRSKRTGRSGSRRFTLGDSLSKVGDGGEARQAEDECTPDGSLLDNDSRDLIVSVSVALFEILLERTTVARLRLLLLPRIGRCIRRSRSLWWRVLVVVDGPTLGLNPAHDGDEGLGEPSEEQDADERAREGESQTRQGRVQRRDVCIGGHGVTPAPVRAYRRGRTHGPGAAARNHSSHRPHLLAASPRAPSLSSGFRLVRGTCRGDSPGGGLPLLPSPLWLRASSFVGPTRYVHNCSVPAPSLLRDRGWNHFARQLWCCRRRSTRVTKSSNSSNTRLAA